MSDMPSIDEMKARLAPLVGWPEGPQLTWRWHTNLRCYMLTSVFGNMSFGAEPTMNCQVVEMDGMSGASKPALLKALETAFTALCVTTQHDRLHKLWAQTRADRAKLAALRSACRRIYTRAHRPLNAHTWSALRTCDEFCRSVGPMLEVT